MYLVRNTNSDSCFSGANFVVQTAAQHVTWVRPPRQARSQETLDRILDAAEKVVSEKGFDRASISEIVQLAGSSVGAFYSRFRDKESLLGCLHDRFCEEAFVTTDTALEPSRWEGASVREILVELVSFLTIIYAERRGMFRAFIVRSSTDPSFAEDGARLSCYIMGQLTALLVTRRDEITHPDPELAVAFGLRLVFDMLDQSSLYDESRQVHLGDPRLAEELSRVYIAYLGVS